MHWIQWKLNCYTVAANAKLFQIIESMKPKFDLLNQTVEKIQSEVRKILDEYSVERTVTVHRDMCTEPVNNTESNVRLYF